jgi:hypothetical protein
MAKQRETRLPVILRNPIQLLEMAEELREHADNVEKVAANEDRVLREKPRVLKIRAFAKELEKAGTARIGNQLNDV